MLNQNVKVEGIEETFRRFVSENGLLSSILYEICAGSGLDYGEVFCKGFERYRAHTSSCVVEESSVIEESSIEEEVVSEEEEVEEEVLSGEERLSRWVCDFERFMSKGEREKASYLCSMIECNEGAGLCERFRRIVGVDVINSLAV